MNRFKLCITGDIGLEFWKDIPGYEGKYQASTYGNIKSLNYHRTGKEIVLKPLNTTSGYLSISLPKTLLIHRIIASVFLPAQKEKTQVNHKDENKTNNRVENLEWCTAKYNVNYGTGNERRSKTEGIPILQIDKTGKIIKEWCSASEAGHQLNISQGHISLCCLGKQKTAYGYIWKYK